MFFFAFFWAFFHVSLSPSIAIGCVWPPKGIQPLDIWGLPLVNTLLLLSSGVTITLAHRAILKANNFTEHYIFQAHLFATISLGITFLCCQWIEYKYGITFTWKENVYGSTFFVTTGFHGLHVIIGTLFLLFCLVRSILTLLRVYNDREFAIQERRFLKRHEYLRKQFKIQTENKWKQNIVGSFEELIIQFNRMYFALKVFPLAPLSRPLKRAFNEMKSLKVQYRADKTWKTLFFLHLSIIEVFCNYGAYFLQKQARPTYLWMNSVWPTYGFSKFQHVGFEAAAWYWHFVDVVWLFLFISIYWWGS
jgi:heme/copper-type cytochrome/quinol oxidase subunit 3